MQWKDQLNHEREYQPYEDKKIKQQGNVLKLISIIRVNKINANRRVSNHPTFLLKYASRNDYSVPCWSINLRTTG